MDANTWARAKDLIAEALALPESEREAFLRTQCHDPVLLDDVKSLIADYDALFLVDVATAKRLFDRPVGHVVSDELQTGISIGPYTILERLGIGGMGQVYLATDPRLKRRVALKCLLSSPHGGDDLREQILREARAAARISHQNVATIYDVVEHGDRAFIVMEYVEGEPREQYRARSSADRSCHRDRPRARRRAERRAQHIVHRDLKPRQRAADPSRIGQGATSASHRRCRRRRSLRSRRRRRSITVDLPNEWSARQPLMSPEQVLDFD